MLVSSSFCVDLLLPLHPEDSELTKIGVVVVPWSSLCVGRLVETNLICVKMQLNEKIVINLEVGGLRGHLGRVDPLVQIDLRLQQTQDHEEVADDVGDGDEASEEGLVLAAADHEKIAVDDKPNHVLLVPRDMDEHKGEEECRQEEGCRVAKVAFLNHLPPEWSSVVEARVVRYVELVELLFKINQRLLGAKKAGH